MTNRETSTSRYFELRNVDPSTYENYSMPTYLRNVLVGCEDAKILDVGCGFGQMLSALKKDGFSQVKGLDIAKNAVEFSLSSAETGSTVVHTRSCHNGS